MPEVNSKSAKMAKVGVLTAALLDESDRGVFIVVVALLDAALKDLIVAQCKKNKVSGKNQKKLLNGTGPLGNFASKVLTAYAFGLIDLESYQDIITIKGFRDKLAHSYEIEAFDEETDRVILGMRHAKYSEASFKSNGLILMVKNGILAVDKVVDEKIVKKNVRYSKVVLGHVAQQMIYKINSRKDHFLQNVEKSDS